MRRLAVIFLISVLAYKISGQTPVGSWSDHLVYNSAVSVCQGENEIYASNGSSVLVFNKEYNELKKLTKINGLTETGISAISWSEEFNTLVISYITANVDLVKNNSVYNIPDISRKYIPGKKEINRIRMNGRYAYLACSFGIVVTDIVKNEVRDTWKPMMNEGSIEVLDIAFGQNKIYAATTSGVYMADITNPGLSYYGNWKLIDKFPDPYGRYTSVIWSGNRLYANYSPTGGDGDRIFSYDGSSSLFSFNPGVYNRAFDYSYDGFIVTSASRVRIFGSDGSVKRIIEPAAGSYDFRQAVESSGAFWIADSKNGLLKAEGSGSFTAFTLPGPVTNNASYIYSSDGKTIITAGGTDASWNNLWRSFQVSVHNQSEWSSLSAEGLSDAMRVVADPQNPDHIYVSSWGGGLLEFKNNELFKQYTYTNSPLQTIIPGRPYVRICGVAFDRDNNLWMTQSEVQGSIKVLKPDGSWILNPLTIDVQMIGDITIARNGYKWIVLPRGNGIFVFDDNNTPEIFTDDRSKKMYIEESGGDILAFVYSIAEDLDGNIWIGTDQGPVVYYNPERIFTEKLKAFRLRIPRNDGSNIYDYMLSNESVTSIAVDGANRKWLGTLNSGVYLLSPDGTLQIRKYTEENSPLLSSTIISVAADNKTGEVWFATAKGIQSVRSDAKEGLENFKGVYAFPNPVRPEFSGNVTITGLMADSDIKITDISGNLVYETKSLGGEASWNLKTYNGKRVTTGVYIAFCSGSDGSKSAAVKILILK